MAKKSKQIWLIAVVALGALGIWAWRRSVDRAIPVVRTHKVTRLDIHGGVITSGKAEPAEIRELRAEIAGIISRLNVKEGDRVQAGAVIAEISVPGLAAESAQAASELAAATEARRLAEAGGTPSQLAELQAQLNQARRVREQSDALLKQSERLAEKGAIARIELEQARQAQARAAEDLALAEQRWKLRSDPETLKQADARLRAAKAALELAESRGRKAAIHLPLSGVVYSLPMKAGDFADANAIVARVGDVSRLKIRVFVDEPDLGRIALGQQVHLEWDGLPGKTWIGKVEGTPAEVEARDSRTGGEVLASVDNSAGQLLPNTNLTAEIITESRNGVLAIPREALEAGGNSHDLYVLNGEQVELRKIETGLMNPTQLEVVKGLAEGDEIVLHTNRKLETGMKVRRTGN